MKKKAHLAVVVGLLAAIASFGIVETSEAIQKGSQRLRGLGDRVFLVNVTVGPNVIGLPVGFSFLNCYFFNANGSWLDPAFPAPPGVPGLWFQDSNGAATSYTASAASAPFVLEQEGAVTPAGGRGVLQLEAISTLSAGGPPLAEFSSVGAETDVCPL